MAENYEFEEEEFTTRFNGGTLRRVLGLLRPHWKWVVGFLATITVTAFLDAVFTLLSKRMVDDALIPRNTTVLYQTVAMYGGLVIVQAVLVLGFIFLAGILGERVQYDLRKKLFDHLQDLSFSYFSRTPVGWIMSRVTSDSERIAQLVTWGMLDVTWAVISVASSMAFMLAINWRLALIVLALIPILLVVAVWFKQRILVEYRNVRKLNSKITGEYNQNITGVRVVKALGREQANLDEFSVLASDMYRASYRAAWLSALFLPAVQIISAVAVGSIVVYGGLQAGYGGLTIGGIQAFISYVTFMMWPIQDLARVYADMQHAIASAERSFSLVDAQPEVTDRPGAIDPGTIRGDIEFDHVVLVRRGQAGVDRLQPEGEGRRDDRTGGADGRRQDDHRQSAVPLLRAESGRHPHRGPRLHRTVAARHSLPPGRGAPDAAPLLGHDPGEHPLRPARCDRR
jgi:ATP-binding cassette subfamily B protein